MKPLKLASLISFVLFSFAAAHGQETIPAPTPTPQVSAEKRALIKEILDLTNSRKGSEAIFSAQFDEMEKQMPEFQWQAISSMNEFKKLSPEQQEDMRTKVRQTSARMTKRIKELFLQRINMQQLVEDISYVTYDKHFSEAELKDLVTFYRSDTGKKVVAEMPALFAESIARAGELIAPKVKEIVNEIQKDQNAELAQEIDLLVKSPPKTPPKRPAPFRRRH